MLTTGTRMSPISNEIGNSLVNKMESERMISRRAAPFSYPIAVPDYSLFMWGGKVLPRLVMSCERGACQSFSQNLNIFPGCLVERLHHIV